MKPYQATTESPRYHTPGSVRGAGAQARPGGAAKMQRCRKISELGGEAGATSWRCSASGWCRRIWRRSSKSNSRLFWVRPRGLPARKSGVGRQQGCSRFLGLDRGGSRRGPLGVPSFLSPSTSRTFCKVLSSVSFNLQLVQDPIEDSGLQRADQSHHGWVLRFGSARQPI
jgi:hypothetical protein